MDLDEIKSNFEFLDDWEDRYQYVIELGKALPPLPEDRMTDDNKVHGCVSQVWLATTVTPTDKGPVLTFEGTSDALIVKGLVAIMLAIYSGNIETSLKGLVQYRLRAYPWHDGLAHPFEMGLMRYALRPA